ncbi:amidase domain-containing protein [Agromyces sp. ZXT2-6]|uniref:amidase domain-containing protein n=1 Tax=Agromyces sp. ZXT2-6 TaxID=3461153 RepID=UPI0040552961
MIRSLLVAGLAAGLALCATGCAGIPPLPPQATSPDAAASVPRTADVAETEAPEEPAYVTDEATDPAVLAQLDYVLAYWSDYNDEEWGVLEGNDCVNFTSQALAVRGWEQNDDWYHGGDPYASSPTWRSSTAMRDWLMTRPDLATPLDDSRRDEVQLGDIVQFDWDVSGDRDHTGIVTRIERGDDGVKVYFAGHTLDSDYRDVDVAITEEHPGAAVYYWRLAD